MSERERSRNTPLARKEPRGSGAGWTKEAADEFRRFQDLTRRLITVPKKDIDEKRKGKS